jgi:hypothetical protein
VGTADPFPNPKYRISARHHAASAWRADRLPTQSRVPRQAGCGGALARLKRLAPLRVVAPALRAAARGSRPLAAPPALSLLPVLAGFCQRSSLPKSAFSGGRVGAHFAPIWTGMIPDSGPHRAAATTSNRNLAAQNGRGLPGTATGPGWSLLFTIQKHIGDRTAPQPVRSGAVSIGRRPG